MGILQAKEQFAGTACSPVRHGAPRLVVVAVVEALAEPFFLIAAMVELERSVHCDMFHLIVVVGIVLIRGRSDGYEPALAGPSEGDIAAMGVERTIALAGIDVGAWTVVGDDVDDAAAGGIAAEVD